MYNLLNILDYESDCLEELSAHFHLNKQCACQCITVYFLFLQGSEALQLSVYIPLEPHQAEGMLVCVLMVLPLPQGSGNMDHWVCFP